MDLRQLRYFIAVAEAGGFRRAAERLHITQPPLSLQIQSLERDLGVVLFERGARVTRLTAAGQALLRRGRAILASVDEAQLETTRVGRGETGRLVLGVMSAALLGRLPPLLGKFRERAPDVAIVIEQRSPQEQIVAIASGEIDVGFLALAPRTRLAHHAVEITSEPLWQEALAVALPSSHHLAKRSAISLSELAKEPFVSIGDVPEIGYHQRIVGLCRKAGFAPDVRHIVSQLPVAMTLISAGYGVGVMPACMSETWRALAAFPRLATPATISVAMIWRRDSTTPLLKSFLDTIRGEAGGKLYRAVHHTGHRARQN